MRASQEMHDQPPGSADPRVTEDFPALRNGPTWVAGFKPIVQYLQKHSACEHNPDEHQTERERADTTAYAVS